MPKRKLSVSEMLLIDNWLEKCMREMAGKSSLDPQERKDWYKDLSPFPSQAIDYAFESHRRNSLYFPVPSQILDLCVAWDPPSRPKQPLCDAECRSRHYRGYHWNDFYWIMAKLKTPAIMGPRAARKKPIAEGEIDRLMAELDSKRPGGAPEWRKQNSSER